MARVGVGVFCHLDLSVPLGTWRTKRLMSEDNSLTQKDIDRVLNSRGSITTTGTLRLMHQTRQARKLGMQGLGAIVGASVRKTRLMWHRHVPEPGAGSRRTLFPLPSLLEPSQSHLIGYHQLCNISVFEANIVRQFVEIPVWGGKAWLGGQLSSVLRDQPGSARHSAAEARMALCYYAHPSTPFHHLGYLSSEYRREKMRKLGTELGGQAFLGLCSRLGCPQAKRGTNACGFELAQ
ncbi:uncharacterized protein LY79DRAFT_70632 [Colletotrichum navitas]|uniref:Uncharacterized protein n=1 Tax=Colletotrichum navitas TaxID=681940 RepID=A0AAD8PLF1_9PEZI|nr:uncharacterized protein LY79DRAFT_70632 [Colletotrichum navitas]KAK1569721.1 hypothetical protein LY79DRAFT_70632 [Colletotrichum navitas]